MTNTAIKVHLSDAEIALREGMVNIVLVTIGENLRPHIICEDTGRIENDAAVWQVTATATPLSTGRQMTFTADVPVSLPDANNGGTRIADRFFKVAIDDYLENFQFEAWCECNPHLGTMAIVRMIDNQPDRWLIGGGMEQEVVYRGEFARMPQWAKDIAYKNFGGWIDTPGANLGPLVTD